MTNILILAAESSVLHQLCAVVAEAGCCPWVPHAGEDVFHALDRVRPDILLLDCDFAAPATLLPAAARRGSSVAYVAANWSPYSLVEFARRAGVQHYVMASGVAGLQSLLTELHTCTDQVARPRERHGIVASASAQLERARVLAERSRELVATARELRVARQIALAACRANRELLREAVTECTLELRRDGVALEDVRALVRSAIEGTIASSSPALLAEVAADAGAAEAWCVEVYKVA